MDFDESHPNWDQLLLVQQLQSRIAQLLADLIAVEYALKNGDPPPKDFDFNFLLSEVDNEKTA